MASHSTLKLPISELKIGMVVCDLDRPWLETPFALQGFILRHPDDIAELARYCHHVYVDSNAPQQEEPLAELPATSHRRLRAAEQTHSQARALTRSFMDDVRLGRAIDVKAVKTTVAGCVRSIMHDPDAMGWVARIRDRDAYTSEHCLNVGLLAITFGHFLGADEAALNRLGVAGILHDVGKMQTPLEILNKEGSLNREELQIMQSHARQGRDILMSHHSVPRGAVDVAFNHHEALDGSGYPRRLQASSIDEQTRIITLCDVYDAITSDRVYKEGKSPLEALRIIYRLRGNKFDADLAERFIQCIGIYPPGSLVELETGEIGIVITGNRRHRHLPKVLVVRDADHAPCVERVIDLERVAGASAECRPIRTTLANGSFGVRLEQYIERGLRLD